MLTANNDHVVPSRIALNIAEYTNHIYQHENNGFLSEHYGFVPLQPPLLQLPNSHQIWDEIASELPKLYRTGKIRNTLDQLPLLSAAAENLPDHYLCRASTLLGLLAHAYYWLEPNTPQAIPKCLQKPWQQTATRLQRHTAFLSYSDLILYNWRFKENASTQGRKLNNLQLLIATVDETEEAIFYLTQLEMAILSAPMIGAIVRAQEAVMQGYHEKLKTALYTISCSIEQIITSLQQISPNPYSQTYVNPIIWAKAVAPLAVTWQPGVKGPSGTSSPFFPLLDAFLQRTQYQSQYGQDQLYYRTLHYPKNVQAFLNAVTKISIPNYIKASGDSELKGSYHHLIQLYAGRGGLLDTHRIKVYGYLDTAFKAQRSVTVGGSITRDPFIAREWHQVNQQLEHARQERWQDFNFYYPYATLINIKNNSPSAQNRVKKLSLNLHNVGLSYQAGDRCALLIANNPALISRTLHALNASGKELITLNPTWRQWLAQREKYEQGVPPAITLKQFLEYAKLRPLTHETALKLYTFTRALPLKTILETQQEDQWELWDTLLLIKNFTNYNLSRLWKAYPYEAESLCNILPPETVRFYSISCAPNQRTMQTKLELTVATLHYTTQNFNQIRQRQGSFAYYLAADYQQESKLEVSIARSKNFHLPTNTASPLVMFAAGTGIGSFRGFIQQRLATHAHGENWLFFLLRSPSCFYYKQELTKWAKQNKLHLFIITHSTANKVQLLTVKAGQWHILAETEENQVEQLFLSETIAPQLIALLLSQEEGGMEGYFYTAGQSHFTQLIFLTLKHLLRKCGPKPNQFSDQDTDEFFYRLLANNRYNQDVFSVNSQDSFKQTIHNKLFNRSEIATHNNTEHGYWLIIDNQVYDLSSFIYLHPGGNTIIKAYAGIDASIPYQQVSHHLDPSINAQREIYKIGTVNTLNFANAWGIYLTGNEFKYITVEEFYQHWINYFYLIIEIENSLNHNIEYYQHQINHTEGPLISLSSIIFACLNAHQAILNSNKNVLFSDALEKLWSISVGLAESKENNYFIHNEIVRIYSSKKTHKVINQNSYLLKQLETSITQELSDKLILTSNKLINIDKEYIINIKNLFNSGLKEFELHQKNVVTHASKKLTAILKKVMASLVHYHNQLNLIAIADFPT